jgi:NADH dehydrogenase
MRALFITGGTGFVGRSLLQAIDPVEYHTLTCLSRSDRSPANQDGASARTIRIVRGDLRNPASYTRALAECDTVLHLAAATGRVSRDDAFSINADGTRALIQECRRYGIQDFLFVSTIAVKYPGTHRYPYARAKQQAEAAVRESGLRYAIVRPTIVMGSEAPIWRAILALAARRVIVMPGRGDVRVQPIFVNDLVAALTGIVSANLFQQSVYEVGGPEITSFDEFLRLVHRLRTGREPTIVHLPVAPIMTALFVLESALGPRVPVGAGQLSAFRYDSTADPALAVPRSPTGALGLADMIRRCLADA